MLGGGAEGGGVQDCAREGPNVLQAGHGAAHDALQPTCLTGRLSEVTLAERERAGGARQGADELEAGHRVADDGRRGGLHRLAQECRNAACLCATVQQLHLCHSQLVRSQVKRDLVSGLKVGLVLDCAAVVVLDCATCSAGLQCSPPPCCRPAASPVTSLAWRTAQHLQAIGALQLRQLEVLPKGTYFSYVLVKFLQGRSVLSTAHLEAQLVQIGALQFWQLEGRQRATTLPAVQVEGDARLAPPRAPPPLLLAGCRRPRRLHTKKHERHSVSSVMVSKGSFSF